VPSELSPRERDRLRQPGLLRPGPLCRGSALAPGSRAGGAGADGVRQQRAWLGREFANVGCQLSVGTEFALLNPALVRFSSGTTGTSKGVVLFHETLLQRVIAGNSGMKIGKGDRIIWILPMAHHFAVSIILYLLHGACTVTAEFSPSRRH